MQLDSELIIDGNALLGSTFSGGNTDQGTVFRLDLTPRLEVSLTELGPRISWSALALGYGLQTSTNLSVGGWIPVDVPITNNFFQLTNLSAASFFRLSAQ